MNQQQPNEPKTAEIVKALDKIIQSSATAYVNGNAPIEISAAVKPIVDARDRLEQLEAALSANWIPCSIDLPGNGELDEDGDDLQYLVTIARRYQSGYVRRYTGMASHDLDMWWDKKGSSIEDTETVVAWMPLPKQYEGSV